MVCLKDQSFLHDLTLVVSIQGHTSNITEIKDPNEIIDQYKTSVRLAKDAGFDGVEILAQG